jgi:polyphosphate kinase 2
MKVIKNYLKFFESLQDDINKSIKDSKDWKTTKFHLLINNNGEEIHTPGKIDDDGNIIDNDGNKYPIGFSIEDDSMWISKMGFDYSGDEEFYYAALKIDDNGDPIFNDDDEETPDPVPGYENVDGEVWHNLGSHFDPSYEDEDEDIEDGWVDWMSESVDNNLFKIEEELKLVEERILDNVTFDIKTQKINVDPSFSIKNEINNLITNLGEDIVKEYNIQTFLLKIKQIIELGRKSTRNIIKDEFIQFISTLSNRNDKFEKEPEDEYFDKMEGEKSIVPRKRYEDEKFDIQVELKKLEEWAKSNGKRIAIVFEGRDAAGKGSTIKRFVEYLNPKNFRIVALGVPTEEEKNNWFERYEKHLPNAGEIVFFDRSWYNRAVVEPAMGYCTEEQYKDFMDNVLDWEEGMIKDGLILIKFWFSITQEKQQQRFKIRQDSPLKYWKFSPNDAKVIDKYEVIGNFKNQMFNNTSSSLSPWVIVNSMDKRIGQLNSMRYVLDIIDYEGKDESKCKWYPEVINIIR